MYNIMNEWANFQVIRFCCINDFINPVSIFEKIIILIYITYRLMSNIRE